MLLTIIFETKGDQTTDNIAQEFIIRIIEARLTNIN